MEQNTESPDNNQKTGGFLPIIAFTIIVIVLSVILKVYVFPG